jgi:biopolymer transport protein TolR
VSVSKKKGGRHKIHKAKAPKLDSVRNEINVTPLVDVCLVMLIIFMVILPMLTRGKELELPKTWNHAKEKDHHQPIVAIDKDEEHGKKMYVDKEVVPDITTMKAKLQDQWKALQASNQTIGEKADRAGENLVLIKAHPEVKYKDVYPVIMAVHDAGAAGIDLGTNEVDELKQAAK